MTAWIGAVTGVAAPFRLSWRGRTAASNGKHSVAAPGPAPAPEAEQAVLQRLSQKLGIPAATPQAQRERTRLGWGDLLIANRLAQKTRLTFDQVDAELDREALFHIVWAAFAARRLDKQ